MSAEVSITAAAISAPSARARTSRMGMALLGAITALLLALGASGWWFLAGIDARYSKVLAQTATSMNELHEVSLHAFTGYGTMMELRQLRDPEAREARLKTIAAERAANDRLYEQLESALTDPELRTILQQVMGYRAICRTQANALMAEPMGETPTAANLKQSAEFLESCIVYQQAINTLTDLIETNSLKASRELAAEIKRMRWLFLGVGVLPIVAAIVFLTVSLGMLKVVRIDGEEE